VFEANSPSIRVVEDGASMDLPLFWFVLLGVLLTGYAILDGFDLGVGTLHPLAKTDEERRLFLNAIGPVWDGNEVWLVTFGGALFAAFPRAYATAFSAFYLPFMLLLFGLVFRAVAIEFRSKKASRAWRGAWDFGFFAASAGSALLFGTATGTMMQGIPIDADGEFTGTLSDLVTPYGLLVGAFTVAVFALHGNNWLRLKTVGALNERLKSWTWPIAGTTFALYVFVTIATLVTLPHATANFARWPWAWGVVVVNVLAFVNVPRAVFRDRPVEAFLSSGVAIACLVSLFGLAQFPRLVTSSLDPALSLDLYAAASSQKTLSLMRTIAFLGMPFVVGYTAVIYWVFRGRVVLGKNSY